MTHIRQFLAVLLALVAAATVSTVSTPVASAAYSHEITCNRLNSNGNMNTAAFYNNARYGAGNWNWYSAFGGFDFAMNSIQRVSGSELYCHGSFYAKPYNGAYTAGTGNRCQFYGRVLDDALVFQRFEQCFTF